MDEEGTDGKEDLDTGDTTTGASTKGSEGEDDGDGEPWPEATLWVDTVEDEVVEDEFTSLREALSRSNDEGALMTR